MASLYTGGSLGYLMLVVLLEIFYRVPMFLPGMCIETARDVGYAWIRAFVFVFPWLTRTESGWA